VDLFANGATSAYYDDMSLVGVTAQGCDTPSDVPWLSADPTSGTTAAGGSDEVTVTLDATGLAVGVYEADLCVESNDAANPLVTVPVTMTVTEPVEVPDIEVDPTALSSMQPPDQTVTETFDISNVGDGTLNWSIVEEEPAAAPVAPSVAPASAYEPEAVTSAAECDRYANYAGAEPIGYAEICLGVTAAPAAPAGALRDPTDTAYALDIGFVSDNFVMHELGDFPGQTVVGPNAQPIFAMDFDETATTLYAIDNTSRQLGTLNLATGAFTAIAPVTGIPAADNISGLTIDPATGTAYVSGLTTGVMMSLYTLDLTTAVATLIGSDATVPLMIDIALGPQGVMYGHEIGTDAIYTIDMTTGAATLVGGTGVNSNFAQGMDFDNVDGTLYAYTYQGGGANVYGTIDLATGALTPLATSNPQGEFEGATQTAGAGGCVAGDIPWASADPTSGATGAGETVTIDVVFDSTGLSVGVYTGTLCVLSDDPDEPEVLVALTLEVTEVVLEPDITVDPLAISETLQVGQTASNDVTIGNVGDADLEWSVVEAADDGCVAGDLPWASADPTSGTTAAGGTSVVAVTFDATGLAAGTYDGALCVNSNDPDEPTVAVALTLTVVEPPPVEYDLYLPVVVNAASAGQAAVPAAVLLGGLLLVPLLRRRR
jgi:hypothetical protein